MMPCEKWWQVLNLLLAHSQILGIIVIIVAIRITLVRTRRFKSKPLRMNLLRGEPPFSDPRSALKRMVVFRHRGNPI